MILSRLSCAWIHGLVPIPVDHSLDLASQALVSSVDPMPGSRAATRNLRPRPALQSGVICANCVYASYPTDSGCDYVEQVPVAFPRPPDAPLRNDWTFVNAEIPLNRETAASRLEAAHKEFVLMKLGAEPAIARLAVDINASNPPYIFGKIGQAAFSRHSVVFSNVPVNDSTRF